MRMRCFSALLLLFLCSFLTSRPAQTQESASDNSRKLLKKVDPAYPEMAKRVNLTGTVKVYAVVATDGSVKTVEPLGGSPVLVQASEEAIKKWKFAPAAAESKELIELHFHPN